MFVVNCWSWSWTSGEVPATVALGDRGAVTRAEVERLNAADPVRMLRRVAVRDTEIARGDVLDEEWQRRSQPRDAPHDREPIGPRAPTVLRRPQEQLPKTVRVLQRVVREEREVGPPAAALR